MSEQRKVPKLRFPEFTDDWEQRKFGDTIQERREKSTKENEDTLLSCAINGIFLNSDLFSHFRGSSNIGYLKIRKNDLILSAQNLHLGNCNVNLTYDHGIVSPAYKVYELVNCYPYFMQAWVKKDCTKQFFLKAATEGASVCRKNIVWEDLYKQNILIPSYEEQVLIGDYFYKIDNLITLHQRKCEVLKKLKKGLLQKMFPKDGTNIPEIRFPEFTDAWEQHKLNEITSRVQGNNGRLNLQTLTISAGNGWMKQEDRFSANIAGKEQKNYTLLKQGELAYNHGNSKLAKYGAVFELKDFDEALVPRVYHSFRVNNKTNSSFIEYLFATKILDKELGKLVSSGARMDGLLNIGYEDFVSIKITVPSFEEQQKIASYFRKVDEIITLHQRKLEVLKKLKKGLLQQMFV